jgi:hypothetical protein
VFQNKTKKIWRTRKTNKTKKTKQNKKMSNQNDNSQNFPESADETQISPEVENYVNDVLPDSKLHVLDPNRLTESDCKFLENYYSRSVLTEVHPAKMLGVAFLIWSFRHNNLVSEKQRIFNFYQEQTRELQLTVEKLEERVKKLENPLPHEESSKQD